MEFILTLVFMVGLPAALLSRTASVFIWRTRRPYAKLIAVVVGVLLFVVLAWAAFVALAIWSAEQGHPM